MKSIKNITFISFIALITLTLSCTTDEEPTKETSCACENNTCALGDCIIELQIAEGCGATWGKASVYLGDTSPEAKPVGVTTEAEPFRSCQPFKARITPAEATAAGIDPQDAESIPFQVVSENERLFFPPGNPVAMCSGSAPQVFILDCP